MPATAEALSFKARAALRRIPLLALCALALSSPLVAGSPASQCSAEQISLVKTWFKEGLPAVSLSRSDVLRIAKSGDFASVCNATPYTATHQSGWSSLRVRSGRKGLVTITAEGYWTSGPEGSSGSFTDVTTYRLLPDRVRVVRHRATSGGG